MITSKITIMTNLNRMATPACPECGKPMRRRHSGKGDLRGCSAYPDCRDTRDIPQPA